MLARNAFLNRPGPENGLSGSMVQRICLEFDTGASEILEGMGQQQQLALSIDACAPPIAAYPRPPNFEL